MKEIKLFEQDYIKADAPKFEVGDTVKVHHKIVEGTKERIQVYQGVVIGIKGSGINETFTVRKVSFQIGVEKVFPVHSPRIDKVEIVRHSKVRRAKLYYLRNLSGKSARLKERIVSKDKKAAKAGAKAD